MPLAGAPHPVPPLPPIPDVNVRDQFLAAHQILADWQPGDPPLHVRWAAGVMQAQHAADLSRFWRSGDHADLHGPCGFHTLGGGRLFNYDQDTAWVDTFDDVVIRVTWDEVASQLIGVDLGLRELVDEVAAVYQVFREAGPRDEVWYDVRQLIQRRSFQAAAAVWESIRPADLPSHVDAHDRGERHG